MVRQPVGASDPLEQFGPHPTDEIAPVACPPVTDPEPGRAASATLSASPEAAPPPAQEGPWPGSMAPSLSSALRLEAPAPAVRGAPAIPGYEIVEELGRGGMGIVYKARQLGLNRFVALKMILAGTHAESREVARFRTEAEAAARLRHPQIVPIHEVGEQDGLPWFALEYVEGGTLGQQLAGRPQPPRQAAATVASLARAVHYAHEQGIVHRDLKPSNILLTADGQPKITDFGLAKKLDEVGQTLSGAVVGTPAYMAPEQAAGKTHEVGPPADVYALGATLYEMLTGRPPFGAETPLDTVLQVLHLEPIPPRRLQPGVARELETICLKCLQKEPHRRYASAGELADDLHRYHNGEPIEARPVGTVGRLLKWTRRQPVVAGLVALVALISATGLAGVLSQWQRAEDRAAAAEDARRAEASAREGAERARRDEAAAGRRERGQRQEAEKARQDAEETLVDAYTAFGVLADDAGQPAEAVLWFATAAELARSHPYQENANRVRVRAWLDRSPLPVQALPHEGQRIQHMAFHPGGKFLLVQGATGRQPRWTLWDLQARRPVPLPGDRRKVVCAAWNPEGTWLALGTSRDAVELYHFPQGRLFKRVLHPGPITALAFSADGNLLALAGTQARVWDCPKRRFLTPALDHPAPVLRLAFSPAAGRLATACGDGQARVFAVPGDARGRPLFAPVRQVLKHDGEGWQPGETVFLNEDLLVTHTGDSAAVLRNATTGQAVHTIDDGGRGIMKALPGPDGRYVAVCQYFGTQLWDVATRTPRGPVLPQGNFITAAAFSPDGRVLLTSSGDRTARLWSVADGQPLGPPLHQDQLTHAAFSPDGRHFATAQDDGLVRVWALSLPDPGNYRVPVADETTFAALSPDGRHLLPTGTHHKRLGRLRVTRVCDLATGQPAGPPLEVPGCLTGAAFAPDGRHLVTLSTWADRLPARWQPAGGREPHLAQVWEWGTGARRRAPVPLPSQPAGAAYSPDGALLVIACTGGEVLLFDAATGRERQRRDHCGTAALHHFLPNCWVRFAPDGRRFVTCGLGDTVRVWDARTGAAHFACRHKGLCFGADFSADGRLLVTCSEDKTAAVWDTETGRRRRTLKHPDWVFNARFHPRGGRLLLTACRDHLARLWDWQKGEEVCPALRHKDEVYDVRFTPQGDWLLTASRDGTARAWEGSTGKPVTPALALGGWGYQILVPPTGSHAVVAGLFPAVQVFALGCLKQPERPEPNRGDLRTFAEIVSGQVIHRRGGASNLTAEQWLDRWRRFDKAHPEYLRFDPPPETVLAWHRRQASVCERDRDWFGAAWHLGRLVEYARATAVLPGDEALWHRRALVCLQLGDGKGYRSACVELLDRFGKTSRADVGARVVRVWALAAAPGLDPGQALPLAERMRASFPRSCTSHHSLGGLLYRAGRFDDAVTRLTEAVKLHGNDGTPADWLFLAMAHHRLGRADEARKWLDKASRWIESHWAAEPGPAARQSSSWQLRLELRLLHREAMTLVNGPRP